METESEHILDATNTDNASHSYNRHTIQRREIGTRTGNLIVSDNKQNEKPLLKISTHNIWNNVSYFQERLFAVIRALKKREPDVACLVDVSTEAYNILEKNLDKHFISLQVFTAEGNPSGIVLLCNKKTIEIPEGSQPYYYDYPQGGRILGAEIQHIESNFKFHILATRLDDNPDNDHIREQQCDIIYNVVKKIHNYILVGDINIYSRGERAEVKINKIMNDSWIKIQCPSELRFTYNGKSNPLIRNNERIRNSRIYYKTKKSRLTPKAMSLICIGNISNEVKFPPSPYYGLEVIYQIKKDKNDKMIN
uniref:Endonuclease/exonuclease/phosphatase domain-containing protein n=1 Tax=viral metagenome TaxID=1070528 RepID=A0A6C0J7I9_9ZZZZ